MGWGSFELDRLELGERAAHSLSSENDCGWGPLWDTLYLQDLLACGEQFPTIYDDDDPFWLNDVG